ncbi:hypothetical protein NHX12_020148 [Muraenolepis orangiensis]|uniref:Uncharacterized protein n=1 Tax=Muraenolepis orangiensis TaxID=630683 RepID=A0A9Q0EV24_9TELE|nr:hypothetical protein NHX12_020148 [Muraenolepis orangiensis]
MLLREPLIHNARLDISNSGTPGLTVALCRTKTLCLQQLVDAVGPELSDAQALGSLLGLHSVRVAQRILQLWSQILCPEEKGLLRSYGQGGARPDPADPFPEIYLSPGLGELTAPLLQKLWGGYVYLLFMAVALTALWVTWFRMPETRGRSFDDIAEEFHGARAEFK